MEGGGENNTSRRTIVFGFFDMVSGPVLYKGKLMVQVEKCDFQVDVLFERLTLEEALWLTDGNCPSFPMMRTCASPHLYSAGIRAPWRLSASRAADRPLWGKLLAAEATSRTGERGYRCMPRSLTAEEIRNIRISQIDLCFRRRLKVQCIGQERANNLPSGNLHF